MSLVQSATLYGHDPWAYLKDVLTLPPTYPHTSIFELQPHRWRWGLDHREGPSPAS